MIKYASFGAFLWLLAAPSALAQQTGTAASARIELGRLANGAAVVFVRAGSGDWGIEISGGTALRMTQPKPAQIEVFAGGENARQLALGYQSVKKEGGMVVTTAKVADGGQAAFAVEDQWKVSGAVLSLSRKVSVTGAEDNAGFYSAIRFTTAPTVKWEDVNCLIPGLLYGDSSYAGGSAPSSVANYRAKRFSIREDYLSAPLFGVSFRDGNWAAVLDPAPRGDTTQEETAAPAATLIIDDRIQFGALGARELSDGGIELGFWLPGTTTEIGGGFGRRGGAAAPTQTVRRRYHPVKAGFAQSYQVAFRFGKSDSFRDMERNAWRWAWASLNPKVTPIDVEVARRTLMDHLADRVQTVDNRSGIPYQANTITGRANSPKILIWAGGKGTVWFSLVSLFPPTYKNRPNGNRPDIMQMFADMKAKFLRFPGGNYLEGSDLANRWNWKATIGPLEERPGHMSPWGYWSSDGMGLLEFLEWCEDIDMEPVMGVYSGFSLNRQSVPAGDQLKPYVQDALDQIEYTIGDASTTWGARRIKDGHPAPFKLNYVEIGNEEILGRSGYADRYAQFYDAIKAKYPNIKVISAVPETTKIGTKTPDVVDDHHYMSPPGMLSMWNLYDNYNRSNPPLLLGEWATRLVNGSPQTPNLEYGLCDGVAAILYERNSDIILMQCYAPLFINVNPGASQWTCNLIGYDVLNCYGGVSYHVLKMFSNNKGDTILTANVQIIPTRQVPMRGPGISPTDPRMRTVPVFFYGATRDSASGTIYLKVVNPVDTPLPLHVKITGVSSIEPSGQIVELKGTNPQDLNTITEREKIVSTTSKADDLGTDFTRTFPPYSATVLVLKGK